MKDIAIYGAGGFGNVVGFLDDNPELKGTANEYGKVLGGINWINSYDKPIFVAIAVGSPQAVESIVNKITNPNVDYPNLYAPSVTFLDKDKLKIGKGNIICTNCTISCNVTIGDFNLLNSYITVGHDAEIGNFNVVMPSCNISGGVIIGNGNFFGVQSVVLQYIKIGNKTRVGANSVIMRKTKDDCLYIGNPAIKIKL